MLAFVQTHKQVCEVSECMCLSAANTELDHLASRGPPVEQISRAGIWVAVSDKLSSITVLVESVSVCLRT